MPSTGTVKENTEPRRVSRSWVIGRSSTRSSEIWAFSAEIVTEMKKSVHVGSRFSKEVDKP